MTDIDLPCPDVDGLHHVEWVYNYLGQCVYTDLQLISVFVGFSSIGCWLVAQVPQILINYKLKTAHSLSFFFLLQWFLGDSTNLIGCLLSDQNITQTVTAVYFVFMDIVLFSQYIYFQYIRPRWVKEGYTRIPDGDIETIPDDNNRKYFNAILFTVALVGSLPFTMSTSSSYPSTGRVLLEKEEENVQYMIGTTVGWISAALYLGSRIPQIIKNFRRRSTEGLSPIMFTMAVMGNTTYSASIFMYSTEKQYIIDRLPWIVGSAGTLCFDFTTLIQFFLYRHNKADFARPPSHRDTRDEQLADQSDIERLSPSPRNPRQVYYHRIGIGWQGH